MRKEEIFSSRWNRAGSPDRTVMLEGTDKKSGKPRILHLAGGLLNIVPGEYQTAKGPYVFHRNGKRLNEGVLLTVQPKEGGGHAGVTQKALPIGDKKRPARHHAKAESGLH